jgi:chaperonin cofactor prefoldin
MEELEDRVSFLEREARRHTDIIDGADKRTSASLREMNKHLDAQDRRLDEFKESVEKRFDAIDKRFESVDQRFDHVYGELADIKANNAEIRNILATLVAKLEK